MPTYHDHDDAPDSRGKVACLNCGRRWGQHGGWACYRGAPFETKKSKLPSDKQYLTPDMLGKSAITKEVAAAQGKACTDIPMVERSETCGAMVKAERDADEVISWKAFQHKAPGDCPCGIKRIDCKYHRSTETTEQASWWINSNPI